MLQVLEDLKDNKRRKKSKDKIKMKKKNIIIVLNLNKSVFFGNLLLQKFKPKLSLSSIRQISKTNNFLFYFFFTKQIKSK